MRELHSSGIGQGPEVVLLWIR